MRKMITLLICLIFLTFNAIAQNGRSTNNTIVQSERSSLLNLADLSSATPDQKTSGTIRSGNLSEGFEGTLFPPIGWTLINDGSPETWFRSNITPHAGGYCASILYNITIPHDDWLITPGLLPDVVNNSISFWARNQSLTFPETFDVKLSTTGTAKTDFTVTLATDIVPPTTWTQYTYLLDDYIGDVVYIAVVATAVDAWYLHLDSFEGPPVFVPPANLIVQGLNKTYSRIPQQQLPVEITLSANIFNSGEELTDPTNVLFFVPEDGFDGDGIIPLPLPNAASVVVSSDKLWATDALAVGDYTLTYEADHPTSDPDDRTDEFVLQVNEFIYARDNNLPLGGVGSNTAALTFGTIYEINSAADLTAAQIRWPAVLDVTDLTFNIALYELDNAVDRNVTSTVFTSGPHIRQQSMQGAVVDFPVGVINLTPGIYLLAVKQLTGTNIAMGYDNTPWGSLYIADIAVTPTNFATANNGFGNLTLRMNFAPPPACPAPTALTATNITATSAELGWTSSALLFYVKYNEGADFDPDIEGTPVSPDPVTNSVEITGLTSNTTVYWYVKANCGAKEESPWAGPASFTTQLVVPTPYSQGFPLTTTPSGWNTTGWIIGTTTAIPPMDVNYIYKNLWSSATTGVFTTVNIGPVSTGTFLSFDYALANYSSPYGPPAVGSGNYIVSVSTDFGATYTPLETVINDGVAGWREKEYDLSAYDGENVKIKIEGNRTSGDYYLAFDNFKVEVPPACPAPSALTATNITGTSADLGWTVGGLETIWNIEWGLQGFSLGSGNLETGITDNPYTLSGLDPNTAYDFYVQADCGAVTRDVSTWAGPRTFTTTQIPANLPFAEDFETWPNGWTVVNGTQVNQWHVGTATAYTGLQSAYISNDAGVSNAYTITSTSVVHLYRDIEFTDGSLEFDLSFWWKGDAESCCDYLRVYLVETSYQPLAGTLPPSGQLGGNLNVQPAWTQASFTLPGSLSGETRRLIFVWRNDGSIGTQPPAAIDDIELTATPLPACPAPTALTATGITATSADLGWTPIGTEAMWHVEVGAPGFTPGTGTALLSDYFTPDNPWLASPLTPETDYEFYVKAYCNGFETPKIDRFWLAMPGFGVLDPLLSGGTMDDPGETGEWYFYENAPIQPWFNIWFYNGEFVPENMKKVRMGFWVQSLDGINPGNIQFVVNWSTDAWSLLDPPPPTPFPMPMDEPFIERSPINPPEIVNPGMPQWVEFYYIIEDYNPEWLSVDIWGANIQILELYPEPPPTGSPLLEFWTPGPGGIIVHECLPKNHSSSDWSGPLFFSTPVTCPPPADLTTVSTATDGAEVSWTSAAPEFTIEYGISPYTFTGTANITGIMANAYTFTGLDPATTYEYKVKAICDVDDESEWSVTGSFATQCLPIDLPYCENFDAVTAPAIPECMTVTDDNDDLIKWITYATNPYSAPNAMAIPWNGSLAMDDWFFSPGLNLEGGVTYTVEFYYRAQSATFIEAMEVKWGTDPSASGMTGGLIWDNDNIINITYELASGSFTPGTTGVYYVGWHGYSDADQFRLYVDDICIAEEEPAVPENRTVDGVTVGSGDDECFDATNTITVTNTIIEDGGIANFIAGVNIIFGDGFVVESGAYMWARIDNVYCNPPAMLLAIEETIEAVLPEITADAFFKVFPNPTTGNFKLELLGADEADINVEIYGMMGERVFQDVLFGGSQYEFDLSNMPKGIYFIRVLKGDEMGIEKVIKQ